jgi:hypothetical protein
MEEIEHICKEKKKKAFDLALIHEPSTNSLLMYSIFVEDFALEKLYRSALDWVSLHTTISNIWLGHLHPHTCKHPFSLNLAAG